MDDGTVATMKYVLMFAAIYVALLLTVGTLAVITGFEPNNVVRIGIFVVAIIPPAHKFAQAYGRLPSKGERARFALGCLIVSIASDMAMLTVLPIIEAGQDAGPAILELGAILFGELGHVFLAIMLGVLGLYFLVAYFGFRWFAKSGLKPPAQGGAASSPGGGGSDPDLPRPPA